MACEEYDGDLRARLGKLLLQVESANPGKIHIQHKATGDFRPLRRRGTPLLTQTSLSSFLRSESDVPHLRARNIVIDHVNQSSCVAHGISLVQRERQTPDAYGLTVVSRPVPFQGRIDGIKQLIAAERFNKVSDGPIRVGFRPRMVIGSCAVMKITGTLQLDASK